MSAPALVPVRRTLDLSLYLVTDARMCGARGVVATVAQAVAAGVGVVQLREPQLDDRGFVALGRSLVHALAGTGAPLIVDDRVDLVAAIGADGAHVGQHDLDPVAARQRIGPARWLGLSVQTVDHVSVALGLPRGTVDYLGVGPIWAQATKHDAAAPSGPETLAAIVQRSPWPCVAIGGIDTARAPIVRRCGAAGVAVVSAICASADPTRAARELCQAWESGR